MNEGQNAFEKIQLLLNTKELAALGPEMRLAREPLRSLEAKLDTIFSETKLPPLTQPLVRSLVLLWHDYLDESHSISQDMHNVDGSFLHGIMHRREPDYGNAEYWFHRVGEHPCFPVIAKNAAEFLASERTTTLRDQLIREGSWDPFAFINACEGAFQRNSTQMIKLLERVQEIEFRALLQHFVR